MRRPGLLLLAAPLVAACSDGSFVVSNVDGAPIEAGEHDVEDANARFGDGIITVHVELAGDGDACQSFALAFCETDAGGELVASESIPDPYHLCGSETGGQGAVAAGFVDACSGISEWRAVRGEGRAEIDGDDVHLVFHAELEPEGLAVGTFEVDLDVEAGPPPLTDGGSSPPWGDRPLAGSGD